MNRHFRALPLLLVLVWQLMGLQVWAADRVLDANWGAQASVALTDYFSILEDPSLSLTLAQVQKPENAARFSSGTAAGEANNFGVTRSAYWLRLRVNNSGDRSLLRMLEITNPLLSNIEVHQIGASPDDKTIKRQNSWITGASLPFATRPYANRFFVFPLTVQAHADQVIYLRIESKTAIIIPAQLWTPQAYRIYERNDYLVQAWYFGIVTAMALFNLLLLLALRDRIYLHYINFVLCAALTIATRNGLAKEFFWPDAASWSEIALVVGFSLSIAALLNFMRNMLNTKSLTPKIDTLLKLLIGIMLVVMIGCMLSLQTFFQPAVLLYLVTMFVIAGVSVFCAMQRQRNAILFLIAFSTLMVGLILTMLLALDIVPTNFLTANSMQFGSTLDMLLLAFALADRFNAIRKENSAGKKATRQAQDEMMQAKNEIALVQAQLVQSEKMAALGQLIASVSHEINTPIGAVKSSGQNISDALSHALTHMPLVFKTLDEDSVNRFVTLIERANHLAPVLNSREERALIRDVTRQLELSGVTDARHYADVLVQLNAHAILNDCMPLMLHPQAALILDTASSMAAIVSNTNNINRAVDRANKIVIALKSFSRVNNKAERIETNLKDSIEMVLVIYQGQIKLGVELERQYEEIPPLLCLPDELNQVWTNLFHNALQAMKHKGTLTIGIRRIGNEAVISVGDSGCGIPEAIRDKIFDTFFTTKPVGEGSGLGLEIVKRIIEKHQGHIELKSEVGVGTTFFVHLPYPAKEV